MYITICKTDFTYVKTFYICKTDDQCKLYEVGRPKQVLWNNPEGEGGDRSGRGNSGLGGHMSTYGRFMLMYGKKHHNIVN